MNLTNDQRKVLQDALSVLGNHIDWQRFTDPMQLGLLVTARRLHDDTRGYRSADWLLPDYWYIGFDFNELENEGLLERDTRQSEEGDVYYRITSKGIRALWRAKDGQS